MTKKLLRRRGLAVAAVAATMFGTALTPALAQNTVPDVVYPACDFPLGVKFGAGGPQNSHDFYDRDGNLIRTLSAGRGYALEFINMDVPSLTYSTSANGVTASTTVNADGSSTTKATGHFGVLLFPSDVGGPSSTLYIGQVVYTISSDGVWEVKQASGRQVDICAELTP